MTPQPRSPHDAESTTQAIDLTPMLDVVFILLIFFIVSASFVRLPGVEVERVEAASEQARQPAILVAVDHSGQIWMDKLALNDLQLRAQLTRLRNEYPRGGLVIQADRAAPIARLTLLGRLAAELGISDVSIATRND